MKAFGITIGERAGAAPLAVGALPSVDLLPPEVRVARKSRAARRGIVALAVLLVVASGAGGALAKVQSIAAQVELAVGQAETEALLARQAEFGPVLAMQAEIDERLAARQVIASTEVDWQMIIDAIAATLPEGASLESVTVDGGSPMLAYAQPAVPLQGARVATVSFTVRSAVLLSVPEIEDRLAGVPGFVDVQVPSVAEDMEAGFVTSFVVHLSQDAQTGRFPAPEPTEPTAPASPSDASVDADADADADTDEQELQ